MITAKTLPGCAPLVVVACADVTSPNVLVLPHGRMDCTRFSVVVFPGPPESSQRPPCPSFMRIGKGYHSHLAPWALAVSGQQRLQKKAGCKACVSGVVGMWVCAGCVGLCRGWRASGGACGVQVLARRTTTEPQGSNSQGRIGTRKGIFSLTPFKITRRGGQRTAALPQRVSVAQFTANT